MSYYKTTVTDLFQVGTPGWDSQTGTSRHLDRAIYWAQAVNTAAVWKVIVRWFQGMQEGAASYWFSNPSWKPKPGRKALTPELADEIILDLTEDFLKELNRFPSSGLGPDFDRLAPKQRMAFAEDLMDTIMTNKEIEVEGARLAAEYTAFPPPGWVEP